MRAIEHPRHRARTAAVAVVLFAVGALLGVACASPALASTTGLTPSFCLQASSYCLSDLGGAGETVNLESSGASNEDFIGQLTGRCGGYVTADCPFANPEFDSLYEGSPIVQLYDQSVDRCVGTDDSGAAVFSTCNSVSDGLGGSDGTLFVNHNGYLINLYWSDEDQYGDDVAACMAPMTTSFADGADIRLDQEATDGCPLWTFGQSAVVDYAVSIANGVPEYYAEMDEQGSSAWTGGTLWYGWSGGHHSYPGPSAVNCTGDPDCFTATTEHGDGDSTVHGYSGAIALDCSGFGRWVYSLAYGGDVLGNGSTTVQDNELSNVSDSPAPGDLVFFDDQDSTPSPNGSTHVGVYIGDNQMIDEPFTQISGRTNGDARVDTVSTAWGGIVGYYAL
jgi:cell wall-associated NlpC family hydrolase